MHANQNRPHLTLSPLPSLLPLLPSLLAFSSLRPLRALLEHQPAPPLQCQSIRPLADIYRVEAHAAQQENLQPDVSMCAHADVCEWSWYDGRD